MWATSLGTALDGPVVFVRLEPHALFIIIQDDADCAQNLIPDFRIWCYPPKWVPSPNPHPVVIEIT